MARWLRVRRLGTVSASTERDAIEKASRRFDIEPINCFYKVVVTKVRERDNKMGRWRVDEDRNEAG